MPPGNTRVHVGDVLAGKYRVERIIGIGGMGMVVAASHLELGELRAVKFLLPAMATNSEAVERFTREARAAARLTSEHVVRVYDVGRLDDGLPYLVMEYLAGEDLGAQLSQWGRLPVGLAVGYAMQVLDALAEAHSAGIVHRDLKPQNLLVTSTAQGQPCIKVLDFGISKVKARSSDEATGLTGTEVAMGSPIYMSPEQMRSARRVDGRADLWSLGVILYELLTGREPFSSDTLPGLYQQILQATPTPPSQLNAEIPKELDAVIERALAKDRDQRFADALDFATALLPYASSEGRRARARIASWSRPSGGAPAGSSPARPVLMSFDDATDMQPTVVARGRSAVRNVDAPPPVDAEAGRRTQPWQGGLRAASPSAQPDPADASGWPVAARQAPPSGSGVLVVVLAVLVLALIGAVVIAAIVIGTSSSSRLPSPPTSTARTSAAAASASSTAPAAEP